MASILEVDQLQLPGYRLTGEGGTPGQFMRAGEDGTAAWATPEAGLPEQSGHEGDVLSTDGSSASWTAPPSGTSVTAVASGSIEDGSTVVLNSDGTVSMVSTMVSVAGNASGVVEVWDVQCCFDEGSGKLIVTYVRRAELEEDLNGFAVLGTVSGGSISFGTPVMFNPEWGVSPESDDGNTNIIYDATNGKVVIIWGAMEWGGSWGMAMWGIVGSVSGDTLQFGDAVVMKEDIFPSMMNTVYRPQTGQVINTVNCEGDQYYCVGTVSGNIITFGPCTKDLHKRDAYSAYDTLNDRLVTVYNMWYEPDGESYWYGVVVSAISGNELSKGAEIPLAAGDYGDALCCFDQTAGKTVIVYQARVGQTWMGVVATTSGESVTFGDAYELPCQDGVRGMSYSSAAGRVVIEYDEALYFVDIDGETMTCRPAGSVNGNLPRGFAFSTGSDLMAHAYVDAGDIAMAIVGRVTPEGIAFESSNITAENFLGIASAACGDGGEATVATVGSSASNLSGLTAARKHYVQNDGSLGVVPADPAVYAGLALSPSVLLLKG
jgi:hypothetical protein